MTAQLKNPGLNAYEFKTGDFAQCKVFSKLHPYGIVTMVNNESVEVTHFDYGFPSVESMNPKYGNIRRATKEDAFVHFQSVNSKYEKEIEKGGLEGAISARRQHYLQGAMAQIEEDIDPFRAAKTSPVEPMTGTYVLMGIYSGQGPSDRLQGLIVNPRISEYAVSEIIRSLYPKEFGNIPSDVYNTPATSHGSLVCYKAFEVPKKAIHLIKNPLKLEISLPLPM